MKYLDRTTTPNGPVRLRMADCTNGELYEFVCTSSPAHDKPDIMDLRICTNISGVRHMVSVHSGMARNGNPNDSSALYIHRPDIQLAFTGD